MALRLNSTGVDESGGSDRVAVVAERDDWPPRFTA